MRYKRSLFRVMSVSFFSNQHGYRWVLLDIFIINPGSCSLHYWQHLIKVLSFGRVAIPVECSCLPFPALGSTFLYNATLSLESDALSPRGQFWTTSFEFSSEKNRLFSENSIALSRNMKQKVYCLTHWIGNWIMLWKYRISVSLKKKWNTNRNILTWYRKSLACQVLARVPRICHPGIMQYVGFIQYLYKNSTSAKYLGIC